jgi:hypothetical protein
MLNEHTPNEYDVQNDKFDQWCDQWADAQDKGLFDDAARPASPTPQTSDASFFGPLDTNPTDSPHDADVAYWKSIHAAANHGDVAPDPLDGPQLLQEGELQKYKDGYPPNPMYGYSQGEDQRLAARQLDLTFDEEDIEELAEMKKDLYDLEVQLGTAEVNGKSSKQIESKINSLKDRIAKLSSSMGRAYPLDVEGEHKQ